MSGPEQLTRKDLSTLEYIYAMLGQLGAMAHGERYDVIAHYIEMAYIQTGDTIRGEQPERMDDLYNRGDKRNSVA